MKKRQNPDHGAWNAVTAGAVEIVDREHFKSRIEHADGSRAKLGFNPTRPDIHLGHTVVLRALRRYQAHGHRAVLIIGDWTAQIGDPSGQNVTRPQLTKDEVTAAARTYLDQAWKILDQAETEIRYQSEWFDRMRLEDVVQLMSRYTVARMLARDDFAKRTRAGRPAGMHPKDVRQRIAERLVNQSHPGAAPDAYRHEGGAFRNAGPQELSISPGERTIAQLFVEAGLASSKSEARRLAGQRGISINDQPVSSTEEKVTPEDGWILRRGSHRVVRLKLR